MAWNWRSLLAAYDNIVATHTIHSVIVEHGTYIRLCMRKALIVSDHECAPGQSRIVECLAGEAEMSAG